MGETLCTESEPVILLPIISSHPLQPRRTYKIVQAFLSSVFFHSQVNSLFQVKICLAQSVWWANFQTYLLVGAEWKYVARKGQEIWLKIATISARQQTYTRKGCRELTKQFASFMSTFRRRVEREDDCANSQESWFRTGASKNLPTDKRQLLLGVPSATRSAVFLNIVQKAFDPPPPSFWTSCCKFFLMDFLKSA